MENFKEIAEKCLAGELIGAFKNKKGETIPSKALFRFDSKTYPYIYCDSHCVTVCGDYYKSGKSSEYDIIDFIPDIMRNKIEINIPEGKVPVMEQTKNSIVITWKDTELTYNEIYQSIYHDNKAVSSVNNTLRNDTSDRFLIKTNVIRKLLNIRNYFGKPNEYGGFIITPTIDDKGNHKIIFGYSESQVMFKEKEHAEQAIKMLGDDLKDLFEPW